MSNVARAESQTSRTGRKRSNTARSVATLYTVNVGPSLKYGDSETLILWVHDDKERADVVFNTSWWHGIAEGDMVWMTSTSTKRDQSPSSRGFLFKVPHDTGDNNRSAQLQISVTKVIADAFGWRNQEEMILTKVNPDDYRADHVEIVFQDQYLGRCDMWRLGKQLLGDCYHVDQPVSFLGSVAGKIQNIYVKGKKVSAGHIILSTKAVYRSLSAKVTIFIQVCQELWQFSSDGERYNEKIVHSFLPALFRKWREAGTNHIVTIVLISRVFYNQSETDHAAGPLRQDDEGRWYKDFFKVITDLELVQDWKPTLVSLKDSFWEFRQDILLPHKYHQASLYPSRAEKSKDVIEQERLVGILSFAHDGPLLEALNLALHPTETSYVDRSLSLTGASTIVITPGTGYYRVSKQLLRLTTTRMLDQGFGLDLVSLAKIPLHCSPIFSFWGTEPGLKEKDSKAGRLNDPLWGGDDDASDTNKTKEKIMFWWEPFWIAISFWDQQMDLPFREDRFVARARMYKVQMLGLLNNDKLHNSQITYLPDSCNPQATASPSERIDASKIEADNYDNSMFISHSRRKNSSAAASMANRDSMPSSGSGTVTAASSYRSEKRMSALYRSSVVSLSKLPPIEDSPRKIYLELPPEGDIKAMQQTTPTSSSSGVHSILSNTAGILPTTPEKNPVESSKTSPFALTSKITSSWLFNPFRSGSSTPTAAAQETPPTNPPSSFISQPSRTMAISTPTNTHRPVGIRESGSRRSTLSQRSEEETDTSARSSFVSKSPHSPSTLQLRDNQYLSRRGTMSSLSGLPYSHIPRINPLRPSLDIHYNQSSLASRWQHIFVQPVYRHQIKWKSMVTPASLPLTTEYLPSRAELEGSYDVFSYDFVVDPPEMEMQSFLIKNPTLTGKESAEQARQEWALIVMRGMAALRLAQGFQFVIKSSNKPSSDEKKPRASVYLDVDEDDMTPKPVGASEIFQSTIDPVYLSMNNEIHRISYKDEVIQVRRYVRRMPSTPSYEYQCLVWPKLGVGYTELRTSFASHGLENYGWNRVDMLVAGYEHQFNESLRYWRTRFVVIPTIEPPPPMTGPSGEKLNPEEVRLLGTDKLADLFSKVRWIPPSDRSILYPVVRFLPTDLGPTICILDEHLISLLEEVHATGPMGKNVRSERSISDLSMTAVAKAMREDTSLAIKDHKWHGNIYQDSFTGYDFVSWLVKEFRDVSTREQGIEWGMKLMDQGLIEHCRKLHGFLDGHYFYHLKGEYAVPSTPSKKWFRTARSTPVLEEKERSFTPSSVSRSSLLAARRLKEKKRLVLSQTMVIDADYQKKSDQAESVILHYDLIHNPANVFHFELNWIGTTARCIEDLLRLWNRTIEKYGLKLVEAYVTQISDIRERNPFQSCFPLRLAVAPPSTVELDVAKRIPTPFEGAAQTLTTHYFEYQILQKFNFVLDTESASLYSDRVDVFYSYRRSPYTYSQFVHRTGVAFVQVLGGPRGFLFLTNRLMAPGRMGTSFRGKGPADEADALLRQLCEFCSDANALQQFYEELVAKLPPPLHTIEEPPELTL